jgi:hypothetical protein
MSEELQIDDDHRERRKVERESRTVERFKTSSKGFRRVFEGHFPDSIPEVEAIVYHLASLEAKQAATQEALRLARYPGAGDRDARRFVMGLWENLSIAHKHLTGAMESLEKLAQSGGDRNRSKNENNGDEDPGGDD